MKIGLYLFNHIMLVLFFREFQFSIFQEINGIIRLIGVIKNQFNYQPFFRIWCL